MSELERAALAVSLAMELKPVSSKDGIWRFDAQLDVVFGPAMRTSKEWFELEKQAKELNAGKDRWDSSGYGVVASYAQMRGFRCVRAQFLANPVMLGKGLKR